MERALLEPFAHPALKVQICADCVIFVMVQAELEHRQLARQAMAMLNSHLEDRKGGTKHVILEGPVVETLVR